MIITEPTVEERNTDLTGALICLNEAHRLVTAASAGLSLAGRGEFALGIVDVTEALDTMRADLARGTKKEATGQ